MYLDGRRLRHRDPRGEPIVDESFLLLLHSGDRDGIFRLPDRPWAYTYEPVVDTCAIGGDPRAARPIPGGSELPMHARSVLLLRARRAGPSS
jgi:glycogen operon protein